MIDLHRFLENPFDDPGVSIDELLAFSTDHLQRMIANDSGSLFAERITATTTALGGVESSTTDDQTKLGMRKSSKMMKDTFRKALIGNIGKINGVIVGKFGDGSPEQTECFPTGRKTFSGCTDDKVKNHLETLINGLTEYQGDLGGQVLTDTQGLLSSWTSVYEASETATGAKTTTEAAKRAARTALQLELFKNLLAIALNFVGQPAKLDLYMRQDLLLNPVTPPPAPPAPPTPPTPP